MRPVPKGIQGMHSFCVTLPPRGINYAVLFRGAVYSGIGLETRAPGGESHKYVCCFMFASKLGFVFAV